MTPTTNNPPCLRVRDSYPKGRRLAKRGFVFGASSLAQKYSPTRRGTPWVLQNTDKVTEEFTGKELDEETGLSNHGARLLDPMLGIWNGVDIKREFTNSYSYVGYNPIMFVDLNGENAIHAGVVFVATVSYYVPILITRFGPTIDRAATALLTASQNPANYGAAFSAGALGEAGARLIGEQQGFDALVNGLSNGIPIDITQTLSHGKNLMGAVLDETPKSIASFGDLMKDITGEMLNNQINNLDLNTNTD